jgi:hypothetical protein
MAESAEVTVFTDLVLRSQQFAAELKRIEAAVRESAGRMSREQVTIAVRAADQLTADVQAITAKLSQQAIALPVTAATDQLTGQLDQLRQQQSSTPIVIPVQYVATGPLPDVTGIAAGAGGAPGVLNYATPAPGMAAAGGVGAAAGAGGFLAGAFSRRGAFAALTAIHGLTRLADEVNKGASAEDVNAESDPDKQLQMVLRGIEREHEGLRGYAQAGYSALSGGVASLIGADPATFRAAAGAAAGALPGGLGAVLSQPPLEDELNQAREAERASREADRRAREGKQQAGRYTRADETIQGMEFEAGHLDAGSFRQQRARLDKGLEDAEKTATEIDKGWTQIFGEGPGAHDRAVAFVAKMRDLAKRIHDYGTGELDKAEADVRDAMQLESQASELRRGGKPDEAAALEFRKRLEKQADALDKQDPALGKYFRENVMPGALAEQQQDATRRRQSQENESAARVASEQNATTVSDLRAQGRRTDAEDTSGRFADQQRVTRLQNEIAGTVDEIKLADLRKELAAAQAEAAAHERERTARREQTDADAAFAARQADLKAQNKNKLAAVEAIGHQLDRDLKDAGDDQNRRHDIMRRASAQISDVLDTQRPAVFTSVSAFAADVTRRNLESDPAARAAAARILRGARGDTGSDADTHDDDTGETLDARRKRGGRPYRPNPLTASAEARRRRGIDLRHEREAHEQAVASAAGDAADFADATMPGGYMNFAGQNAEERRAVAVINARADAADLTDAIMPGGGWFGALHPAEPVPSGEPRDPMAGAFAAGDAPQRTPFGNDDLAKLLADTATRPDWMAAVTADDKANPARRGGMFAGAGVLSPATGNNGMFAAGEDAQANNDFKRGSGDLKDAAETLKRTLTDERNHLYVVR